MKGIRGAVCIKRIYGSYVIVIECDDESVADKLIKKMRIIGLFVKKKSDEE